MDAGTLYRAISEVCPAVSAKCDVADNRATWSFVPEAGATQPQIDAGNNVIQTIPMEPLPPLTPADFISSFTDVEYLNLKKKYADDLVANDVSGIKIWDIVIGKGILDMNSADAQALKADLIADGILTQARANEIFGTAGVQTMSVQSRKRRF